MKQKERDMLGRYREWFSLYLQQAKESTKTDEDKAYMIKYWTQSLHGMLILLLGAGEITKKEYDRLKQEVEREFDTEKLYGFGFYTKMEVFGCSSVQ